MAEIISLNARLHKNLSYTARSELTISDSPQQIADMINTKGARVKTKKIYTYINFYYL